MAYVPTGIQPTGQQGAQQQGVGAPAQPLGTYDQFRDYLRGVTTDYPSLSSGPASSGGLGEGGQGAEPLAIAQPVEGPQPNQVPTNTQPPAIPNTSGRLFNPMAGGTSQGLFDPIRQQAGEYQGRLQGLQESFQQAAGADRSFEGIGAESALRRAIDPTTAPDNREGYQGEARSLLGASYGGPEGLNAEDVAKLRQDALQTQTQARALQTGGGLQTVLSQGVPGLTPGEAAFEAQRVLGEPGYHEAARDVGFQATAIPGAITQGETAATARAGERQTQEQQIAQQSRDYLTGRRGEVSKDIQGVIDQDLAQQKTAQEQFNQLQQTGDVSLLPQNLQAQLQTPGRTTEAAAEAARAGVMGKYSDITQYAPLERVITGRGKQWYGIQDPKTGKTVDIRKVKGLDKKTQLRLVERQRELEGLFGNERGGGIGGEPAQFGAYEPLYFDKGGTGFEPQDFRPYTSFDQGVSPSRENVSTDDQKYMFNTINGLLDEVDRISEAGEPYRAAQMALDIDKYLADEEDQLNQVKGNLTAEQKHWRNLVKKARHAYRRKKETSSGWGIVQEIGFGGPTGGSLQLMGQDEQFIHEIPKL